MDYVTGGSALDAHRFDVVGVDTLHNERKELRLSRGCHLPNIVMQIRRRRSAGLVISADGIRPTDRPRRTKADDCQLSQSVLGRG
jgi:hypothetical protein